MNAVRGLLHAIWLRRFVSHRPTGLRIAPRRPAGPPELEGPAAGRMTTHAGGRRGPWESAWLVVLAAVLVAVVAGYGISRVHGYAAERGKLKDLLGELETAAYHESALAWQAIAEPRLRLQIAEEWHEVDEATHQLADQLRLLDPASAEGRMVRDAFERYDAAVEGQFALLEQRQVAEAKEVDEQRVDPAFAGLGKALVVAGRSYGIVAERAKQQADLGTLLILLAAAINVGALAWRSQRVKSQAAERFAYPGPA